MPICPICSETFPHSYLYEVTNGDRVCASCMAENQLERRTVKITTVDPSIQLKGSFPVELLKSAAAFLISLEAQTSGRWRDDNGEIIKAFVLFHQSV